jgi:GxxExxY protein
MIKQEYQYSELTSKIIGCAMNVHNFLGNGFQEVIYQRALHLELSSANIESERELEMHIYYKDFTEPIGTRRADFIIEGKILVEIKAITELEDVHLAQILNYLNAYKLEVGLLINFGAKSLQFKRAVNTTIKSIKSVT